MRRAHTFLRNLGLVFLALVLVAFVLALVRTAGPGSAASRVATKAARETVAFLRALPVGVAEAQQVLDFKPVPAESASRFDRMRVVRRARAAAVRESLSRVRSQSDVPTPPDVPDEPDVPDAPTHGRTGSIMRIGSDIHVEPGEVIEGDISSVNGDIVVEGRVQGDVMAMRGDVDLKSTAHVDGDVVCIGGTLSEEPGARVDGQRVTAPGAANWREFARHQRDDEPRHDGVTKALVWLLLVLMFTWVIVKFAPGRSGAATDLVRHQPGMALAIGALVWALIIPSLIALVLVVALLCITIIGIPLALAALFGYFVFLALLSAWGLVVGGIAVGGALSSRGIGTSIATGGMSPAATASPPSLLRMAILGVLVLAGSNVIGQLLHALGPLHGFGTLIIVLSWVGSFLAATLGAGALLRAEFASGTLGRWWAGRRSGSIAGTPPAGTAATPAGTPDSGMPGMGPGSAPTIATSSPEAAPPPPPPVG